MNDRHPPVDGQGMRSWLAGRAGHYAKIEPSEIDYDTPLSQYGLDSVSVVSMAVDIEDEYGVFLDVDMLWELRTVNLLADMLTARCQASSPG